MRNHWVNVSVSGRQTDIATGPRRKDGDMTIDLAQINEGTSQDVLRIRCYPTEINGIPYAVTTVTNLMTNEVIFTHYTVR